MTGLAFNDPNFLFSPNHPYTLCKICGAVFQSVQDRAYGPPTLDALLQRREWSFKHAAKHSAKDHQLLKASGRFATPEAAHKLAAYGVIPIIDMVMDEEVEAALAESKPTLESEVT